MIRTEIPTQRRLLGRPDHPWPPITSLRTRKLDRTLRLMVTSIVCSIRRMRTLPDFLLLKLRSCRSTSPTMSRAIVNANIVVPQLLLVPRRRLTTAMYYVLPLSASTGFCRSGSSTTCLVMRPRIIKYTYSMQEGCMDLTSARATFALKKNFISMLSLRIGGTVSTLSETKARCCNLGTCSPAMSKKFGAEPDFKTLTRLVLGSKSVLNRCRG